MGLSRRERVFEARFRKKLAIWPRESPWLGVLVCVLLTSLAAYLHALPYPPFTLASGQHPISTVLLALLLGMALRNAIPATRHLKPGVDTIVKKGLPVGIVLLGAMLNFYDLLQVAWRVLIGAAFLIAAIMLFIRFLTRWLGIAEKLGLLIGVGTAICGSSAIVTAAPILDAKEEEIAYSIGTINLLGVAAMLAFPLLGSVFELQADVFGIWCGLGIHATPQVIAAGFAHYLDGQRAGEIATVVKLVRISLLGPTLFVLGAWYAYRQRQRTVYLGRPVRYTKLIPGFVVLFLGMVLLRTLGFFPEVTLHMSEQSIFGPEPRRLDLAAGLGQAAKWVITCAMVGVGLSTEFRAMRAGGARPLLLGALAAVGIALLGLLIASLGK